MKSDPPDLDALGIMIDEGESAHEILGLPRDASSVEVRAAYIRLVKEHHPDTHPEDLAAERRFKSITKAYNELRSPYHVIGGERFYRSPEFRGAHRRVLAVAVLFFLLAPLAIFLVMGGAERSGPSLELRQAEGAASPGIGDAGGTAPVEETTIETSAALSAPPETTAALETDRLMRSPPLPQETSGTAEAPPIGDKRSSDASADGISVASLSKGFATDARFPGSASPEAHPTHAADEAHRSPETAPPEQARTPGLQAPSPHDEIAAAPADDTVQPQDQNDQKVASVQPEMQDERALAVEPQARPNRDHAAAERTRKKSVVASKTAAAITLPVKKQGLGPEQPVLSARAALPQHFLDRSVMTAAPGG